MAGGTSVPPQDSRCEPWSGQRKDFWLEKEKTCGRTKRSRRSDGEVSLDNADAVIEGAPSFAVFEKGGVFAFLRRQFPAPCDLHLNRRRMQKHINLAKLLVARIFSRHHEVGQSQNAFHEANVCRISERLLDERIG